MKKKLLGLISLAGLLSVPTICNAQAVTLGSASGFALFTSIGAITNVGISQVTGHVGSNVGSSTGFGNVNGVMNDQNAASALCAADVLIAYNQLNATVPAFFPAPLLGNGQSLNAGVYSISGASTLNNTLTLNAQGNPNALFIFKIQGTFASGAGAKVLLINGAKSCNVYWKIEGAVTLASGTSMKGTIIANNAAINLNTGTTLEGRALSTSGAVGISNALVYTPVGCGSPFLTGPTSPTLNSVSCYGIFSSNGPVTNSGNSFINGGDIGTNVGLTTGFNPLNVTAIIHPIPDGSTGAAAADLLTLYTYLNTLPYDIELLYPAQFGNKLVLTPHVYQMNGAVTFIDTLFLNGMGNANAVFVISTNGAFSTGAFATVVLTNGTQAKNVFWKVDGAFNLSNNTDFKGTVVANNGAVNLSSGTTLIGRALTTNGAVGTAAINVTVTEGCTAFAPNIITQPTNTTLCGSGAASFSISSTGYGLTYQWRKGSTILVNGGNISGATTPTLTINPVTIADSSSFYNVIASGVYAAPDTSNFVSLTVNEPPTITSNSLNLLTCSGDSTAIVVTTTGNGLNYQWRRGTVNLVNTGNISGVNSATLLFNPVAVSDGDFNYNVIITGLCAPTVTSPYNSMVVYFPATITAHPTDKNVCLNNTASFNIVALGANLSYQWRKGSTNIINGSNITGATTATLNIVSVSLSDFATNYNVVVTGSCAPTVTSTSVALIECNDVGIKTYFEDITLSTVNLFPNPFNSELTVTITNFATTDLYEIKLYNLNGSEVFSSALSNSTNKIEISSVSSGLYYYKVLNNQKLIQSGKLISTN